MTIALKFDQVTGCRGEFGPTGWRIERQVTVTGLTGDGPARILAAVTHASMPRIGANYYDAIESGQFPPTASPSGMYVTRLVSIIPQAVSPDTVVCTLVYERSSRRAVENATIIEVGTVEVQTTTNKDKDGETIFVEHNGDKRSVLVSTEGEESYLICRRVETSSPESDARFYVNHVNASAFRGDGPRTWRCAGINGVTNDNGTTYEVTYEFRYREETFDINVLYIDSETGSPPDDLVEGVGDKWYRIKGERNFNALNLGI